MVHIQSFTFNAFSENTYLLYDDTKECVIIDPGCYELSEQEELKNFVQSNGLKVVQLINTHCHVDHVLGNAFVKDTFGVKLFIHKEDEATLRSVQAYGPSYGFVGYTPAEADGFLEEGQKITFGDTELDILFVPGHAPGHVAFYHKDQGFLIGGDVLFRQSIGRTDLPGGDMDTLVKSIREQCYTLPDETVVYPGHGPETTIGFEKENNMFVRG